MLSLPARQRLRRNFAMAEFWRDAFWQLTCCLLYIDFMKLLLTFWRFLLTFIWLIRLIAAVILSCTSYSTILYLKQNYILWLILSTDILTFTVVSSLAFHDDTNKHQINGSLFTVQFFYLIYSNNMIFVGNATNNNKYGTFCSCKLALSCLQPPFV